MQDILSKMQETAGKYAAVISQVLDVDVEIINASLERIAGTGRLKDKLNHSIENQGDLYKKVIETGKRQVIDNPGEHAFCKNCPQRLCCEETFDMGAPIRLKEQVVGVIGLICFTEEQKFHIQEHFDIYTRFLDQIAELIASKTLEIEEMERNHAVIELLNEIIDNVEEGIIVLDRKQKILKINSIGRTVLGLENETGSFSVKIIPSGNDIPTFSEYKIIVNGIFREVIGRMFEINNPDYNRIFMFKDAELAKVQALALAATKERFGLDSISGESEAIRELKERVKKIASSNSTVLITGESGTGKELFARALHEEGDRMDDSFVAVNCGAIPEGLLESELFGYVKGAFTGADPKGKIGLFEQADRGTLFLDEIGDMPIYLQTKLLRALEQKIISRLGSNTTVKVDVRVIAATNQDLEEMVAERAFREDLFYRLNVIPLKIPPLRSRKEDIHLLASGFIHRFAGLFGKRVAGISQGFWDLIERYAWPGNVRELQNTIEYVINMMEDQAVLTAGLLPEKMKISLANCEKPDLSSLEQMEEKLLLKAFELYGSDGPAKRLIAEKMGIGIATLYRKLKKYDIG